VSCNFIRDEHRKCLAFFGGIFPKLKNFSFILDATDTWNRERKAMALLWLTISLRSMLTSHQCWLLAMANDFIWISGSSRIATKLLRSEGYT